MASEQQNYKSTTVTVPDIDTKRMKEENTLLYRLIRLHFVLLNGAQYKINMYLQRSESEEFYRNLVHT